MKYINFLILVFISAIFSSAYSQAYLIEYKVTYGTRKKIGKLYASPHESYYKEFSGTSNTTTPKPTDTVIQDVIKEADARKQKETQYNPASILIREVKNMQQVKYVENHTDHLYSVLDTDITVKWHLTNETKKIHNYACQKATGTLKGRLYEAWFWTENKFPYGPWKLGGLPGIILEAASDDKKYSFHLASVKLVQSLPAELNHKVSEPILTYEAYCNKVDVYYQKEANAIYKDASSGFANKFFGAKTSPIKMAIQHIEKNLDKTYVSTSEK